MSDVPERTTITDALAARAAATPHRLAYAVANETVTYGELYGQARRVAGVLRNHGITEGERCAIVLPTSVAFIRAAYGVQLLGAALVALNPALPPARLAKQVALTRCRATLIDDTSGGQAVADSLAEAGIVTQVIPVDAEWCTTGAVDDIVSAARPDLPAFLQLTSGTTGEPRAAIVRHRNLTACLRATCAQTPIGSEDVIIGWLPLYHDYGLVRLVFTPVFAGCPGHLLPPDLRDLGNWLRTASRVGATITAAPDFAYRLAARTVDPAGIDLSTLKEAASGGEPVRMSTIRMFESRFGVPGVIRPGYGLAEATLSVTKVAPGEPVRTDESGAVSCGRPFDGVRLRIVDASGNELPQGVAGEITVGGETVFAGYFDDEEGTRAVLRDGWLHTGDMGRLDRDGSLFVLGRARSLIKRAGATIAPRELEEAADRVDGVRFSAATSLEDARTGTEQVIVVAEVRDDTVTDTARSALANAISQRVVTDTGILPNRVILVRARTVPRTPNGKIRYDVLRSTVSNGVWESGGLLFDTAPPVAHGA